MHGLNPVAGTRVASEGFSVNSVWYTIQGEGPFVGCPAIFVRLSGCNLRCFWCDTEFESGKEKSADQLAQAILRLAEINPCRFIVITGGEPMLQPLKTLIDHPTLRDFAFQIETAGSVWPIAGLTENGTTNAERLSIVCSPKTGTVVSPLRHFGLFNVYWKYIVRALEPVGEDGLPVMSTQIKARPMRLFRPINTQHDPKTRARIFVQGCDEGDQTLTNANVQYAATIALTYGYRLSLQTHKLLGLD